MNGIRLCRHRAIARDTCRPNNQLATRRYMPRRHLNKPTTFCSTAAGALHCLALAIWHWQFIYITPIVICVLPPRMFCVSLPASKPMAMEKATSFFSSLLGGGGGGSPEPAATVRSITVYPLKSCRGISVLQAAITATGFRWDRQWMVVNAKGRAVTQRVEPSLALVEAELPPEAFAADDWQPDSHSHMVIRAPGMDPLKIPLAADAEQYATIDGVGVWDWSGSAYDEGPEAAEWFSSYLGKPSWLVRFKEVSETRQTDPDYAQGYKVMFSDAFPILIASQGSLDALNEVLKEPVRMNRFRANLLVDGCHPYSEDLWKTVKINNLTFMGVRMRDCCKVPTVDQENGTPGIEPNETLRAFRSGEVLRPSHTKKGRQVYFGQNLVCKESLSANGKGRIVSVGDPVYVLQSYSSTDEAPA